jgi:hypothetical protein
MSRDKLINGLDKITQFLDKNEHFVFECHLEVLRDTKAALKSYSTLQYRYGYHGFHYDNCPWFNDEAKCGPDTCGCYRVTRQLFEAEKIIKQYERIMDISSDSLTV